MHKSYFDSGGKKPRTHSRTYGHVAGIRKDGKKPGAFIQTT